MSDKLNITVFDNGPFKLSGVRSMRYCGDAVPVEGDVFLCRCGQSSNAPFCDGTHNKVGFSDANPEGEEKPVKTWEGRTVRTRFNPNTCMHAYYCKPMNALREAEEAGDDAAASKIARVVGLCPSGALTVESKGADLPEPKASEVDVNIMEGGEVRLQAAFDINVPRMANQPEDRATLCRCGKSKNKPWCDASHTKLSDFR